MGLFDIFRKNKSSALPSGPEPERGATQPLQDGLAQYKVNYDIQAPTSRPPIDARKEADWILMPGSKTVVLPETDEQTGDIIIKLKRKVMSGEMVELGTMLERVDKDTFKYIVTLLDTELDRPREKGGSNPHTLSQFRNIAKREIETLAKEKNITLTPDFYKILENINVKTQLILNPDLQVDYSAFEKDLPQSVDISHIPFDELMQYGEALATRLESLKSIKRPEQTVSYESSLINFMKSKEKDATPAAILAMLKDEQSESQESIIRRNAILECAETAQSVQSEDNLIYSAYLKLEERRILTKIQEDLRNLSGDIVTSQRAEELISMLESTKIQPHDYSSTTLLEEADMNNAVSGFMSEVLLENSVSSYISDGLRKDLQVKAFISQHPELEHSEEAAEFLVKRMRSSGQVADIPGQDSLRAFIENTDYKTPHDREGQYFLLSVAQMEKQHIETFYSPIIQAYNRFIGKDSPNLQAETR